MHTTNYLDTLILPSPDCAAAAVDLPAKAGSVAAMQHERMVASPYGLTSDDLIFGIFADRQGIADLERTAARIAFFSKGQPCLRASPLVKTYGWSIHHDEQGRIALVNPASDRFRDLVDHPSVVKLAGMRSKRG